MKISGKLLWDKHFTYREIWYSQSAFTKDDAKSVGFMRFPKTEPHDPHGDKAVREFIKGLGKNYTESAISTSLTKDWNKEIEVPDFIQ